MVSHHALQSGVVDAVNQAGPDIGSHGRRSGRPSHIECPAHEVHVHSEADSAAMRIGLRVWSDDPSQCCGETRGGNLAVVLKPARALSSRRGLGQSI